MTKNGVEIKAICPTCKGSAATEAIPDDTGVLHAMPLGAEALIAHAHCDLWALMGEVSRRAYNLSKVTTFSIRGE